MKGSAAMKRISAVLLALILMLTGCSVSGTSSTSTLTPDAIFSGAVQDSSDPPAAMVGLTSQQLVDNIRIGWNLGHALENVLSPGDTSDPDKNETLLGNPPATAKMFEELIDSGVNAVRLPISWQDHIKENGTIAESWLNRVTQVVNYAYDCGMYVIITMYGDGAEGSWLRDAATDHDTVLARYEGIWRQLAEKFGGYNERILFESMSQVDFTGVSDDDSYALFNEINQLFVDTVRSSGGNNRWRHLLIAGYDADIICSADERFSMPSDPEERCILAVHYYIPVTFCIENVQNKWGSNSDQIWMENMISQLRTAFTDKGVPVMITEYGTTGNDVPSRVFFCELLTKLCNDSGIAAFLWDDGSEFDRSEFTWATPGLIEALQKASGSTDYKPEKQKNDA